VFAEAGKLSVRTMIIDVEPLVASWRSGQEALDRGIARVLGEVRLLPSVRAAHQLMHRLCTQAAIR
jgi:hypothetical protein